MIKGHAYYYLVRTARVSGKSKTVWQRYLGTAEKINEFYDHGNLVIRSKLFGSVAAMLSATDDLNLGEIIQNAVPRINLKL